MRQSCSTIGGREIAKFIGIRQTRQEHPQIPTLFTWWRIPHTAKDYLFWREQPGLLRKCIQESQIWRLWSCFYHILSLMTRRPSRRHWLICSNFNHVCTDERNAMATTASNIQGVPLITPPSHTSEPWSGQRGSRSSCIKVKFARHEKCPLPKEGRSNVSPALKLPMGKYKTNNLNWVSRSLISNLSGLVLDFSLIWTSTSYFTLRNAKSTWPDKSNPALKWKFFRIPHLEHYSNLNPSPPPSIAAQDRNLPLVSRKRGEISRQVDCSKEIR